MRVTFRAAPLAAIVVSSLILSACMDEETISKGHTMSGAAGGLQFDRQTTPKSVRPNIKTSGTWNRTGAKHSEIYQAVNHEGKLAVCGAQYVSARPRWDKHRDLLRVSKFLIDGNVVLANVNHFRTYHGPMPEAPLLRCKVTELDWSPALNDVGRWAVERGRKAGKPKNRF